MALAAYSGACKTKGIVICPLEFQVGPEVVVGPDLVDDVSRLVAFMFAATAQATRLVPRARAMIVIPSPFLLLIFKVPSHVH
jgi:hypothetical protein